MCVYGWYVALPVCYSAPNQKFQHGFKNYFLELFILYPSHKPAKPLFHYNARACKIKNIYYNVLLFYFKNLNLRIQVKN